MNISQNIFSGIFLKNSNSNAQNKITICLAVSTVNKLRYTKIKFQRAKHLITFHNKKSTVVIQPNKKQFYPVSIQTTILIYLI